MADPYISALQEQAALIPIEVRAAIGEALRRTKLNGFLEFNDVLLSIVGHALAGNIAPDQVRAVTPLLELLFASVSAQTMREDAFRMKNVGDSEDPHGAFLEAAANNARKVRPTIEMNESGGSISMSIKPHSGAPIPFSTLAYPAMPETPARRKVK